MLPDMDKITPENLGDAIREVALGAAEANNVDLSFVRQPQRQPLVETAELTESAEFIASTGRIMRKAIDAIDKLPFMRGPSVRMRILDA